MINSPAIIYANNIDAISEKTFKKALRKNPNHVIITDGDEVVNFFPLKKEIYVRADKAARLKMKNTAAVKRLLK